MIIFDTNVVSELMKRQPDIAVETWAKGLQRSTIYVAAPTVYEIVFGIARVPDGIRKQTLIAAWSAVRKQAFLDRILPFDSEAGALAGQMKAEATKRGSGLDICDLFIASIALRHSATVAPRNVRDFAELSVQFVNPWDT